jgi:hypothetical protein
VSFQTVKCPECGFSQIEYINPDQPVKCNGCKTQFSPFKPVVAKPAKPIKPPVKQQPSTGERLNTSIRLITKQLGIYLNDGSFISAKEAALRSIKLEMPVLLTTITDSVKKDRYDLSTAFETPLDHTALSEAPQRLDLVLSFLYTGLQHLERMENLGLFDDHNHQVFAQSLITKHRITIDKIINP